MNNTTKIIAVVALALLFGSMMPAEAKQEQISATELHSYYQKELAIVNDDIAYHLDKLGEKSISNKQIRAHSIKLARLYQRQARLIAVLQE